MPKAKLSDAVKGETADTKPTSDQPEGAGSGSDTPAGTDTTESPSSESDDDEPEAPAGAVADNDKPDSGSGSASVEGSGDSAEPTAKTLADFRAAFGHEQGSVYFADQTPFVDACSAHIVKLNATIAEQSTKIDELTALNKTLAEGVHGEKDPLQLGDGDAPANEQEDGVAKFAASLKLPTKKD